MFSSRIKSINESPIREFSPISNKRKEEGIKVYHLNIGQPDLKTPDTFFKAIKNIDINTLCYTESNGMEVMLNAFSNYYKRIGCTFNEEDILITNGGSEAILFAFMVLCDRFDEVMVFEPYYSNYNIFAKEVDVNIKPVRTYRESNFKLPNKKEIEKQINKKTKAIFLTNPSNPTGRVYTKEELRLIADIAKENNLFIIVDEVYREFVYEGEFISMNSFKDVEDRVVIIDSVSKRFSACGARIGCLASKNEEFIHHALKLCQARLCAPYIDQIGAAALLNETNESYLKKCNKDYKRRRDVLYEGLNKIKGVDVKKPSGAFYFIVKLPVKSSYDFSKWLIKEYSYENQTVSLTPASEFYATDGLGANEVRVAYVLNELDLIRAAKVIESGLCKYLNEVEKSKDLKVNAL